MHNSIFRFFGIGFWNAPFPYFSIIDQEGGNFQILPPGQKCSLTIFFTWRSDWREGKLGQVKCFGNNFFFAIVFCFVLTQFHKKITTDAKYCLAKLMNWDYDDVGRLYWTRGVAMTKTLGGPYEVTMTSQKLWRHCYQSSPQKYWGGGPGPPGPLVAIPLTKIHIPCW